MSWSYTYDPHIWPAIITLGLVGFLGWYSWSRRKIPGAFTFAMACLFAALWALAVVLEISAVDPTTKFFWIEFHTAWQMPTVTALPCFILVYAGLGRWLTRRNLILLAFPSLIILSLIVTNDYHHLMFVGFQEEEYIIVNWGIGNTAALVYSNILGLFMMGVLVWLAVRSPQHRWPVAIMLFGQISSRGLFLLVGFNPELLGPGESILVTSGLGFSMYGLAFFRYRVFDPVPLAYSAVIDQMGDGMLVLDLRRKIVAVNSVAGEIFRDLQPKLIGRSVGEVLPANMDLMALEKSGTVRSEISLGSGKTTKYYRINLTQLKGRRGHAVGHLLLLDEITEQKKAQAETIEQQRVVATLQERERLARELHDSVGQVLGYVSLQTQTIQEWILAGNTEKARALLGRLADVANDAHIDVRESILSLKAGTAPGWSFIPALRQYLNDFQGSYSIRTDLVLPDGLKEDSFAPAAGIQILRVIQEALTNARKHGGARLIKVAIEQDESQMRIKVADDGSGFEASKLNQAAGHHFGLGFMQERMQQIGGSVIIESQPGLGTVVKLETPMRNQLEERE